MNLDFGGDDFGLYIFIWLYIWYYFVFVVFFEFLYYYICCFLYWLGIYFEFVNFKLWRLDFGGCKEVENVEILL